jgi:ubiquinone/menaquinone biosynthesis C-methylase UbiE
MLDNKFWKNYMRVFDVMNIVIPYQELLEKICQELVIKNGELILDAGSGTGSLSLKIKNYGGRVISIDNSNEALEIHIRKDSTAETVFADLTKPLNFPDNYFDKIACILTLHSIKYSDRQFVIDEFFRILKPGGKIVLANPCTTFSPLRIFLDHLKKDIKKSGFLKVLSDTFTKLGDTIKMFYYNLIIEKESKKGEYKMLNIHEQEMMLGKSGFVNISETIIIYAKSAVLNSAYKNEF